MSTLTQEPATTQVDERQQFLVERQTGIGGSDAASVCGVNPWKTPYQLYLEKRGEVEPDDLSDNEAVKWGNRLEAAVADEYAERTGRVVHRVNRMLRHPERAHMIAHLDRRVVGEKRGLEVKTAGFWAAQSDAWGPSGTDQVPEQYLVQVQHYMAVTGYDVFDLAVLVGGQELRIYHIGRDQRMIEMLFLAEDHFWNCVRTGNAPDVVSVADAKRRYPVSSQNVVEASAEAALAVTELRYVSRQMKTLEARQDELQAVCMAELGECDTLSRGGQILATWKTQTRKAYQVAESYSRVFRLSKVSA